MLNGTHNNIFALIPTIQRLAEPFLIEIFQKIKRFKKIQSFFYRNDLEEIKNKKVTFWIFDRPGHTVLRFREYCVNSEKVKRKQSPKEKCPTEKSPNEKSPTEKSPTEKN